MQKKLSTFWKSFLLFALLFFAATSGALFISDAFNPKTPNFGKLWEILLLVSVGLALIVSIVLEVTRRRERNHINLFIEKMRAMQAEESDTGGKVLLRPDDPLAPLANAVNDVQSLNQRRMHLLQQQASILNALLENMPLGVLRIKPNHEIVQTNDQARHMLRLPDDVLGKSYENVFKNHQLLMLVNEAFATQQDVRGQVTLDQLEVDVFVTYYQLGENENEALILLYDMTEINRLQAMQADFAANASHELRTPLASIIGFSDTLLDGAQDDPEVRPEFIKIIHDEAEHLLDLTNDILTLAKTPRAEKQIESIELNPLVASIYRAQEPAAQVQQIQLLNQVSATTVVQQCKDDVQTILNNLIANAIKYNKPQGQVTVTAHVDQRQCFITVSDTGLGIPSDQQDRIFERFYRLDKSHNKKIPGTGLGLAIVHDLIESMHGTIQVESQVGVGTQITVALPNETRRDNLNNK
ncbi:two-component system phosphate regulon sensor histidine kinase PhoR [Weissella uvarum]|uniref:sensor histidine kinase n=1 Tax=Weissella uvarum TaxID=1479233 RepID=UPI00196066BE|nr:ATP-binding protein [Weissella uvarum]MBM7617513.1 two-component system phosphate regulon sensor histidine kinase PhoR [Weissella uvarum]MCM0595603.1 PAS domain-containing protein [Weissella uvarum]